MGRRGRKPKANVMRTPAGRRSRAKAAYSENSEPIKTRMRLFGLTEKDARDQKAATVIGRLALTGEVSQAQYDAAVEYLRLYEAYKRAIKAPDALRNASGSGGDQAETEAYAAWCQSVIGKHDAAIRAVARENALLSNRGLNLHAGLDYIVCRDQHHAHLVGDCRIALNALARHFGLTAARKSPHIGDEILRSE